jgi:hypothetical protein
LIGPGDAGRWRPDRDDEEFEGGYVRRFASEVAVGDVFLLRSGVATIAAVGLVASEYQYENAFDDVNGLDLQHTRRVRWCPLPTAFKFGSPVFGANPPMCSRVWNDEVLDYSDRFINSPPTQWQSASLPTLPPEDPPLQEIPRGLEDIVAVASDLATLFQDRQGFGEAPSEDELIAHLVVPFLVACGWPPERIAVQWRHIDVAVFRSLPRLPEVCQFVIEAKRFGSGVEGALGQAKAYVTELGYPRDIVVTDGVRYRMYDAARDFEPLAYANLARLKQPATDLFVRLQGD